MKRDKPSWAYDNPRWPYKEKGETLVLIHEKIENKANPLKSKADIDRILDEMDAKRVGRERAAERYQIRKN